MKTWHASRLTFYHGTHSVLHVLALLLPIAALTWHLTSAASCVQKKHHLDPLPEGWFYNGNMFVSLSGDKSATHPDLDKYLDAYLADINLEVDRHNARVEQEAFTDLFDWASASNTTSPSRLSTSSCFCACSHGLQWQ